MKKLLFTSLLGLGLLLPANFSATPSTVSFAKELTGKKPKKSKSSRKSKSTSSRSSKSYSSSGSGGCTYNGNQLYVGSRGGCYYYSGSSKQYVDRSYCSGCR
ncbi:hypothetical protein C1637_01500 [Chryseobacterium lactis]|uniref:PBCV-specific basic adaptor domain-containing protein n=1 Tax=Chryseobacterium lactis TaxID=1241981 RepID=A0A3G6RPP4_CHRLC|nr:hypothetical protein [Chryseobacterium lactis]AZA81278.1 hypothetical protein EG342_04885 [Chryseobacterium lactis]AZB06278.1 hypothetical protein EG341_21010 [Chryseobacterium lactis]PNW15130.1 hypothetical protein C1637_01500 [Chryseobacterium lactis]